MLNVGTVNRESALASKQEVVHRRLCAMVWIPKKSSKRMFSGHSSWASENFDSKKFSFSERIHDPSMHIPGLYVSPLCLEAGWSAGRSGSGAIVHTDARNSSPYGTPRI